MAITGPSGSGKTTLLKVLCGLSEPISGTVLMNGTDIRQLGINNYHRLIACVMQDDRLFSGSIRENICGFTENIDDARMRECARTSRIHDVILALPMGYETLIGELGRAIWGQKQRILLPGRFIAVRIYYSWMKPPAHWTQSVKRRQSGNEKLNITRIIIAHRETTLQTADRIITLGESN